MSIDRVLAKIDAAKSLPNIDFKQYLEAREADRENVKQASDFSAALYDRFYGDRESEGTPPPWSWLAERFMFRPGEMTVWAGFNGHMKSMVTGFCMVDALSLGNTVCIASFEMKPDATLQRMIRQASGINKPLKDDFDKFASFTKNLWFYDQQGSVEAERVLGVVYYAAEQLGVTHMVIDSLMKCVKDEDDYNGQKRFVDSLCAAARDLQIHIHLVHHSRKRENELMRPGKQDSKGSGSIVDQTDNYISVWKVPEDRKKKDADESDFHLYLDKQRHGEWEGIFKLWFDEESLQFRANKLPKVRKWLK